jgi:hypothetical protein
MLHEHNLVSVLHPNGIIELAAGHAPHITLLKSSFRQVSAAVHAKELIPGSAPAQHRVARGKVVIGATLLLNVMLQFMGLLLLHVMDSRTDFFASAMFVFRYPRRPKEMELITFTNPIPMGSST